MHIYIYIHIPTQNTPVVFRASPLSLGCVCVYVHVCVYVCHRLPSRACAYIYIYTCTLYIHIYICIHKHVYIRRDTPQVRVVAGKVRLRFETHRVWSTMKRKRGCVSVCCGMRGRLQKKSSNRHLQDWSLLPRRRQVYS